jgi:hypothetical protein
MINRCGRRLSPIIVRTALHIKVIFVTAKHGPDKGSFLAKVALRSALTPELDTLPFR